MGQCFFFFLVNILYYIYLKRVFFKHIGHAGAYISPRESDAKFKIQALKDAGVILTNHPAKFGKIMKNLLSSQYPVTASVRTIDFSFLLINVWL